MKKKIKLEDLTKSGEIPEELARFIERKGVLEFLDADKLEEMREACTEKGYGAYPLTMPGGKKLTVIMKNELSNAIIDPSADDADILRQGGREIGGKILTAHGKKQLKPFETSFERTVYDNYISSLLMNLVEYPKDKINEKTVDELGLHNINISKLYSRAAAAWLGSSEGLENIVLGKGILGKIENISIKEEQNKVNLSVDNCHSGSHYVLNLQAKQVQMKVQIDAPKLDYEYMECEDQIYQWIMKNVPPDSNVRKHARNLIRLYLNTNGLYDKNKPLPIEWRNKSGEIGG